MAQPSLSPAGSSTYSSNTMHVGDGTWDSTSDTFLLPNIMGFNLATTRYNGMGNRFRQLQGYQSLVTGHAVLAAITFLGIVPAAILIASFYHRNPKLALRIHIGLQVLTVILTTVIFVMGYFAVGPARSLTNPHHGIGLTIYLLILVQAFGGWLVKRLERGKIPDFLPIKIMLHQWLGRGIALLAFAQIPIGLALYGSPKSLFILYSLYMSALLVLYFILVHRNHKRVGLGALAINDEYEQESYTSGARTELTEPEMEERRHRRRRRLEEAAGAVGLGAALTALRRRRSGRGRDNYVDQSDVASTVPPSQMHSQAPSHAMTQSRLTEKFTESDYSSQAPRKTWKERLLGPGAAAGGVAGLAGATKLFRRRRMKDDDFSETTAYRPPPLGGNVSQDTLNVNRMEEGGHANAPYDDWRRVEETEAAQEEARRRGVAQSRLSDDTLDSLEKPAPKRRGFGLPASLGALGAVGGIGSYFKRRKEKREDERVASEIEREHENERLYTSPGGRPRYTGDGTPKRAGRMSGAPTTITERTESPMQSTVGASNLGSPVRHTRTGSHVSAGDLSSPAGPRRGGSRPPGAAIPPPPRSRPVSTGPTHAASPSEGYSHSRSRRGSGSNIHSTTNVVDPEAPLSPPPAVAATNSMLAPPNPPFAHGRSRSQSASPQDSSQSPVASVKVKMHNDGRHVTLRRLNEEEAARERANRRAQGMDDTSNGGRFRREQTPVTSHHPSQASLATPPQGPGVSPPSALGPPSAGTGAGTEVTDFESNRRRRRAERARAEQARAARRGTGHVEFE